jgi:hypothetical protein
VPGELLEDQALELAKPLTVAAHMRQRPAHLGPDAHLALSQVGRGRDVAQELCQVDVPDVKVNVPASMRDVSSTSATRLASRDVSSSASCARMF